jgi:hypothetical protein
LDFRASRAALVVAVRLPHHRFFTLGERRWKVALAGRQRQMVQTMQAMALHRAAVAAANITF